MKSAKTILLAFVVLCPGLGGCGGDDGVSSEKKSVVLVHGAWMGAWCWDAVAQGLRKRGATVTAVELPAHGADATPLNGATLEAYVARVRAAIDGTGQPVTLVGHSMGGVVITAAAEMAPAKISKLVYLGAYMPKDGQSLFDLASTDADSHLGPVLVVDQQQGLARIPMDKLGDVFVADGTPEAIASVTSHYRDEPLAPFVTPVHTSAAGWGTVAKVYIYTKLDRALSYARQQQMTAGVPLASTITLDSSHSPFLSQPQHLVSVLAGL